MDTKIIWIFLPVLLYLSAGCERRQDRLGRAPTTEVVALDSGTLVREKPVRVQSALEQDLVKKGLVNVRDLDSTILVDLKYTTTDNFVGVDVYGDFDQAYLQVEPARKLARAQALLKEKHADYTLLIYDAVRPRRVQYILWDTLQLPEREKPKYVADPREGSIHNYGAAVDLTIADRNGAALDMGTVYDFFGKLAYPTLEQEMLQAGKLSAAQVKNRELLREVMVSAGFTPITTEWWHFNAMSRKAADAQYGIVE